jgi:hypothetical protein
MKAFGSTLPTTRKLLPPSRSISSTSDVAVAVGAVSYEGKASQIQQTETFGWVFQFRERKVVYLRAFRDPGHALLSLGR